MNPKIDKVNRDIEKTRERIAGAQAKLKELERQKVDMENTEIIAIFRSQSVPPGKIAALIKAYRDGTGVPPELPKLSETEPDQPMSEEENSSI